MWPPTLVCLFARTTIAIAFQRTNERMRCSIVWSPGMRTCRCVGIVLMYAVLAENGMCAPSRRARSISDSISWCARSGPSFSSTPASASSHSRVSCGSGSLGEVASMAGRSSGGRRKCCGRDCGGSADCRDDTRACIAASRCVQGASRRGIASSVRCGITLPLHGNDFQNERLIRLVNARKRFLDGRAPRSGETPVLASDAKYVCAQIHRDRCPEPFTTGRRDRATRKTTPVRPDSTAMAR